MSTLTKEFAEQYRSFDDDELLQLTLERQNLLPAASAALDAELAVRGLGDDAVQEFRDRLRTQAEDELDSLPQEPLPPPMELPEDWFDEKPAVSTQSLRPKGVTACAYIFWLSGAVGIAVGSGMIIINGSVVGVLEIALGGLVFVAGWGSWRLRSWARKLGVALCWSFATLMLAVVLFDIITGLGGTIVDPGSMVWNACGIAWQALWAVYLGSETARKAFVDKLPIAA